MRSSDEIPLEAEDALPATARREIAHIPIEHCKRAGRLRYEVAQLRLFLLGQATNAVFILLIDAGIDDDAGASILLVGVKPR